MIQRAKQRPPDHSCPPLADYALMDTTSAQMVYIQRDVLNLNV